MSPGKAISFGKREEWRRWLECNHDRASEAWLLFRKKHVEKRGLEYPDAVEEAIRFGWIDGKLRRVDDETHMIRFTPRKPDSVWSEYNRARAEKLIREGTMTERGLASVQAAKKSGQWASAYSMRRPLRLPSDLVAAFGKDRQAKANFDRLSKSERFTYIYWIESAKKEETRNKRIWEVVSRNSEGKKSLR